MKTKAGVPHLQVRVKWEKNEDPHCPWKATVDGEEWVLRLGDYPAEDLYALLVNGEKQLTINSWPDCWAKEGVQPAPGSTTERLERMQAEIDLLKKEVDRLSAGTNKKGSVGVQVQHFDKKMMKLKKGLRSRAPRDR